VGGKATARAQLLRTGRVSAAPDSDLICAATSTKKRSTEDFNLHVAICTLRAREF
jgi:hypothetical protein